MNIENKTRNLVLAAVFMAIIIIMAFTPFGYIPLGFMNATIKMCIRDRVIMVCI